MNSLLEIVESEHLRALEILSMAAMRLERKEDKVTFDPTDQKLNVPPHSKFGFSHSLKLLDLRFNKFINCNSLSKTNYLDSVTVFIWQKNHW